MVQRSRKLRNLSVSFRMWLKYEIKSEASDTGSTMFKLIKIAKDQIGLGFTHEPFCYDLRTINWQNTSENQINAVEQSIFIQFRRHLFLNIVTHISEGI